MTKKDGVPAKLGIGLVGCGVVGRGLVSLLREKRTFLKEKFGRDFELRLICDFVRGTILSSKGLDLDQVMEQLERRGDLHEMPHVTLGAIPLEDLLKEVRNIDILCDATPTNYETGAPSLGILKTALKKGISAVTCAKGGVAADLIGLKKLAKESGVHLGFESSVLAGTPLISMVRVGMAGCVVERVQGILNGTTNFILSRMEEGLSYEASLAEAQRLGYAETDPTGDVEGCDAAVKAAIMASEFFGEHIGFAGVKRSGLTQVTLADVEEAKREGRRLKLVTGVWREKGSVRAAVDLMALPLSHPLAGVMGVTNAITITTDNLGDVTVIGPGAGARETAQGLLGDMLEIASKL